MNSEFASYFAYLSPSHNLLQSLSQTIQRDTTYFGTLSSDTCSEIATGILRTLQRMARQELPYIAQVCQFIRLGHPFPKSIVTALAITDLQAQHTNTIVLTPITCDERCSEAILKLCAPAATSLSIEACNHRSNRELTKLLQMTAAYCNKNIEILSIRWGTRGTKELLEALKSLIVEIGPTVKKLDLKFASNPHVSYAFTRDLVSLIATLCLNLRELIFIGFNILVLRPMWRPLGNTLTSLFISCPPNLDWSRACEEISEFCPKITKLHISGLKREQYETLIIRYGNQLLETRLSDDVGTMPSFETIRNSCSNARFHILVESNLQNLVVLSSTIKNLSVIINADVDLQRIKNAFESCASRLEKVHLVVRSREHILPSISAYPMPQLKDLSITFLPELNRDTLDPLAQATGGLEIVELGFVGLQHTTAFDNFCESNSKLRKVLLFSLAPMSVLQQKKAAIGILKSAVHCRNLSSLVVKNENEVQNSTIPTWIEALGELAKFSLPFRHRGTLVHLFRTYIEY